MKNEIHQLEKEYWEAMVAQDFGTIKRLTQFPCIIAGKRGVMSMDEPTYKTMFDAGAGKQMKVTRISDEQVQTGADHAMIAYLIELDYQGQSMKCACSSTWVKKDGNWVCAMHTESDLEEN